MEVVIVHSDPVVAIGAVHNVLITVYRRPSTTESLRAVGEAQDRLCARHGDRISTIAVIDSRLRVPGPHVRHEAYALGRRNARRIIGAAVVLPPSGFGASAMRVVITGIVQTLVRRRAYPIHLCSSVEAAVAWTIEHAPSVAGLDSETLIRAIETTRAASFEAEAQDQDTPLEDP